MTLENSFFITSNVQEPAYLDHGVNPYQQPLLPCSASDLISDLVDRVAENHLPKGEE